MRFKAIAGKPQSGVAIPVPTSLIWLSGFLGCTHIASLITITLVLVICPAHVEPREFGNSLALERFMSQPSCFLATSFLQSGSILSPCRLKHPWLATFQQLNRAAGPSHRGKRDPTLLCLHVLASWQHPGAACFLPWLGLRTEEGKSS